MVLDVLAMSHKAKEPFQAAQGDLGLLLQAMRSFPEDKMLQEAIALPLVCIVGDATGIQFITINMIVITFNISQHSFLLLMEDLACCFPNQK